jgi:hypothetical protein
VPIYVTRSIESLFMIASTQDKQNGVAVIAEAAVPTKAKSGLPTMSKLVIAALWANAPFLALYLILKHVPMALSLIGGAVISLTVCSILHVMAGQFVKGLAADVKGPSDTVGRNTAMAKFAGLVIAKFIAVILVTYLVMAVPGVRPVGVGIGFAITQAAVVITVAKMNKGSIVKAE